MQSKFPTAMNGMIAMVSGLYPKAPGWLPCGGG
jgi:hypothetical protein